MSVCVCGGGGAHMKQHDSYMCESRLMSSSSWAVGINLRQLHQLAASQTSMRVVAVHRSARHTAAQGQGHTTTTTPTPSHPTPTHPATPPGHPPKTCPPNNLTPPVLPPSLETQQLTVRVSGPAAHAHAHPAAAAAWEANAPGSRLRERPLLVGAAAAAAGGASV